MVTLQHCSHRTKHTIFYTHNSHSCIQPQAVGFQGRPIVWVNSELREAVRFAIRMADLQSARRDAVQ